MTETSIKDFEAAIAELESIVKKLEEGDLALERSLALYERGVELSRFCHARLEDAERLARRFSRPRPGDGRCRARAASAAATQVPGYRQRGDALQRVRRRQAPAADSDACRCRRGRLSRRHLRHATDPGGGAARGGGR